MSYCRMSNRTGEESDCYVISVDGPLWWCVNCSLKPDSDSSTNTPGEMHDHLLDHRRVGHRVPQDAIDDLAAEGGWGP